MVLPSRSLSRSHLTVRDVFCAMSASEFVHIWLKVKPVFGSMHHLFQTALRLISARSHFISYSRRRSSSSRNVVSRWMHRCLTTPSMCRGHPTGICWLFFGLLGFVSLCFCVFVFCVLLVFLFCFFCAWVITL